MACDFQRRRSPDRRCRAAVYDEATRRRRRRRGRGAPRARSPDPALRDRDAPGRAPPRRRRPAAGAPATRSSQTAPRQRRRCLPSPGCAASSSAPVCSSRLHADACQAGDHLDAIIDHAIRKLPLRLARISAGSSSRSARSSSSARRISRRFRYGRRRHRQCARGRLPGRCQGPPRLHPGTKSSLPPSSRRPSCGLASRPALSRTSRGRPDVAAALVVHPATPAVGFTGSPGGGAGSWTAPPPGRIRSPSSPRWAPQPLRRHRAAPAARGGAIADGAPSRHRTSAASCAPSPAWSSSPPARTATTSLEEIAAGDRARRAGGAAARRHCGAHRVTASSASTLRWPSRRRSAGDDASTPDAGLRGPAPVVHRGAARRALAGRSRRCARSTSGPGQSPSSFYDDSRRRPGRARADSAGSSAGRSIHAEDRLRRGRRSAPAGPRRRAANAGLRAVRRRPDRRGRHPWSMQHGGPWPATSFAGSLTSVGMTAANRRFLRPVVYQACAGGVAAGRTAGRESARDLAPAGWRADARSG